MFGLISIDVPLVVHGSSTSCNFEGRWVSTGNECIFKTAFVLSSARQALHIIEAMAILVLNSCLL